MPDELDRITHHITPAKSRIHLLPLLKPNFDARTGFYPFSRKTISLCCLKPNRS
jgi:hypothetical protein